MDNKDNQILNINIKLNILILDFKNKCIYIFFIKN